MSNVSLTASILNAKVNTGNSEQMWSYNKFEPDAMMCPVWNGQDLSGRPVCEYSFNTKRAGCNSALDRITVENFLRPSYTNFITTNAAGIAGYGTEGYAPGDNLSKMEVVYADQSRARSQARTGKFGIVSAEQLRPSNTTAELSAISGGLNADIMARNAQRARVTQNTNIGFNSQQRFDVGQNAPQYLTSPVTYSVNPNDNYQAMAPRGLSYVKEASFRPCGKGGVC